MLHVTTSRNVAAALDTAAGDMNAGQEHHDKPGLELVHSQHELVHSQHELVHSEHELVHSEHELVQLVHPLLTTKVNL